TGWLFKKVPDESGAQVPNPISLVSRWKILDNLRRSLVEPATFVLLLGGWLFGRSPALWTFATIAILLLPPLGELISRIIHGVVTEKPDEIRDAFSGLLTSIASVFLTFTFLGHQALVSLDAVARAFIRRAVT